MPPNKDTLTLEKYKELSRQYTKIESRMWEDGQRVLEETLIDYIVTHNLESISWKQEIDYTPEFPPAPMAKIESWLIYIDDIMEDEAEDAGDPTLTREMFKEISDILEFFPWSHLYDYYDCGVVRVTAKGIDR